MEIITNDILKFFDLENSDVFRNIKESPELQEIQRKQKEEMLIFGIKRISSKDSVSSYIKESALSTIQESDLLKINSEEAIQAYLKESAHKVEYLVFFKLVFYKFHYTKELRNKIKGQLKECEKLLTSDTCKRNPKLKKEVTVEAKKLRIGLKNDLVTIATNSLYDLYSYHYPNETKTDIYVRISQSMHHLEIYNRKPFPTLTEAYKRLKDDEQNYPYEAKRILYLRVKKHIINNRNYLIFK